MLDQALDHMTDTLVSSSTSTDRSLPGGTGANAAADESKDAKGSD